MNVGQRQEKLERLQMNALNFPGGSLTRRVSTPGYQAPELTLSFGSSYGQAIDIWSIGCILAELLGGKPIFSSRSCCQIEEIQSILGPPPVKMMGKLKNGWDQLEGQTSTTTGGPVVSFAELYPAAPRLAIDLLGKMLCWDPDDRISAEEALQHDWLEQYRNASQSWCPPQPFDRFREVEGPNSIATLLKGLTQEANF